MPSWPLDRSFWRRARANSIHMESLCFFVARAAAPTAHGSAWAARERRAAAAARSRFHVIGSGSKHPASPKHLLMSLRVHHRISAGTLAVVALWVYAVTRGHGGALHAAAAAPICSAVDSWSPVGTCIGFEEIGPAGKGAVSAIEFCRASDDQNLFDKPPIDNRFFTYTARTAAIHQIWCHVTC